LPPFSRAVAAVGAIVTDFGETDSVNASGTINGTAINGPLADAEITAFSITDNGTKGESAGVGLTDVQGNFSISVGDHSGPVLLGMSGGHYIDEATGININLSQNDHMTSAILSHPVDSIMNSIRITPLTTMTQDMAQTMFGGMTHENIMSENNAVAHYFEISDILHVKPMDPGTAGTGTGADQDMINYGMVIAAMSQYASMINLPHSFGIVANFIDDASDGHLDGMRRSSQIMMREGMMGNMLMPANAGSGLLADAMEEFIYSPMNKSSITAQEMETLFNRLHSSNGIIQ